MSLPDRNKNPFSGSASAPSSPGLRAIPGGTPQVEPPKPLRLQKGEMLFTEGQTSRSMYYLKSGMIRIFKKKGDSNIEIDTVHSGQILGELAFLDGLPRSASGEALTECDMLEVSSATFQAVLSSMPDWLKLLLKTVVGRLRTASTRIRQLESASSAFETDRDGKRTAQYTYLSPHDALKVATALLVSGVRNGKAVEGAPRTVEVKYSTVNRYANQVMGIPVAKVAAFMDVTEAIDAAKVVSDERIHIKDLDALDFFIQYVAAENQLEPSKRHDLTLRGYLVMSLIVKYLAKFPTDPATGESKVNLAWIREEEKKAIGREPFRLDEFVELSRLGYASQMALISGSETYTQIKVAEFLRNFKIQRALATIANINEEKRGQTTSTGIRRR